MTKKDYELIAGVLKRYNDANNGNMFEDILHDVSYDFATALQEENPKFDSNKFLEACGIKD